jgi:hypothetical protein
MAALEEEVRKRKVADSLLGTLDDSDPDPDPEEESGSTADDSVTKYLSPAEANLLVADEPAPTPMVDRRAEPSEPALPEGRLHPNDQKLSDYGPQPDVGAAIDLGYRGGQQGYSTSFDLSQQPGVFSPDTESVGAPPEGRLHQNDQRLSDYGPQPDVGTAIDLGYRGGQQAYSTSFDLSQPPPRDNYIDRSGMAAGGAGQALQPGPVPSPLPDVEGEARTRQAAIEGWKQFAEPEMQAPPPRAELVKLPPAGPVALASREEQLAPPRAERVLPPPQPVAAATRELDLAPLAQPPEVRRASLVPPEEYIDPDQPQLEAYARSLGYRPGMAPWETAPETAQPAAQPTAQPAAQPAVQPAARQAVTNPNDQRLSDYTVPGQPPMRAPRAVPPGAAQPVQRGQLTVQNLADTRARFASELSNPATKQLLIASTLAEVGDQPAQTQQAYMESVMNRAAAENRSLTSVLSDQHYYPTSTISKLGRTFSDAGVAAMQPLINNVLGGSNLSNFATGNESGGVHSGGAPVSYDPKTGERFVQENWTKDWVDGVAAGQAKVAGGQPAGGAGRNFTTVQADPAELAKARAQDAQAQIAQKSALMKLPEAESGNLIGFYNRLSTPVEGVNDGIRTSAQAGLKPQIIQAMREKYPELKSDDEAWAKAQGSVNALDLGREWLSKALGYGQQFTNVMQKGVAGSDQLHVNQFLNSAMPGAGDDQKHAYLSQLYAMPIDQQIAEISSKLPQPQAGIPSTDPQQIISALHRLSDPNFQKQQATDLANAKAEMERNVSSDPRLKGTFMEKIVDSTAQLPSFIAAFSNPALIPVAMAQVSDQVREAFRAEHPEWDEKTLTDKSAWATLTQFYGQEIANRIMMKGIGPVVGGLENKAHRAIAQAVFGAGSQAAIAAGTQAVTNIIAGDDAGKGVAEAATAGALQGGVTGVVHGAGELRERVAPVPEVRPVEPAPVEPVPTQRAEAAVRPVEPEAVQPPVTEQPPPVQEVQPPVKPAVPVTQEDVSRRAYEISEERQRTGQSGDQLGDWLQAQRELSQATEPPPATVSEAEPVNSAIANRYVQDRMASGELGRIDPGTGKSTEDLVTQGLKMSPKQRDTLIDNFVKGKGGDLDDQGAAIRSKEALLSQQASAADRAARANPTAELQAAAEAASQAVTDFHNGPIKKFKQVWSDAGRGLQREIPLDFTTLNGMKEAYLKANDQAAPATLEPKLKQMADAVTKASDTERAALNNLGVQIENQTRGKRLPTDDQVRTKLMDIMKNLPCPT